MLVVRNISKANIRVNDGKKRYLIKAGGESVELPDSVLKVDFFDRLVKSKELEVVKKKKEKGQAEEGSEGIEITQDQEQL